MKAAMAAAFIPSYFSLSFEGMKAAAMKAAMAAACLHPFIFFFNKSFEGMKAAAMAAAFIPSFTSKSMETKPECTCAATNWTCWVFVRPLDNASIVKPMGTGWQFCDHHPSHKSFQTNAATFAIIVIIAKPFRLQHRDFLLRHSMASRGKRSNANDAIGKTISALSPASLSQKKEKAVPREVKWKSGLKWISKQLSAKATEERGILSLVIVRIRNLP
nr:hypothetical protein Iba_chr12cCG10700 [Ipomoea batatas]